MTDLNENRPAGGELREKLAVTIKEFLLALPNTHYAGWSDFEADFDGTIDFKKLADAILPVIEAHYATPPSDAGVPLEQNERATQAFGGYIAKQQERGRKEIPITELDDVRRAIEYAATTTPPAASPVSVEMALNEVVTNGRWTKGEQRGEWAITREVYETARDALSEPPTPPVPGDVVERVAIALLGIEVGVSDPEVLSGLWRRKITKREVWIKRAEKIVSPLPSRDTKIFNEAIEEAAKVADVAWEEWERTYKIDRGSYYEGKVDAADVIAQSIRDLKRTGDKG